MDCPLPDEGTMQRPSGETRCHGALLRCSSLRPPTFWSYLSFHICIWSSRFTANLFCFLCNKTYSPTMCLKLSFPQEREEQRCRRASTRGDGAELIGFLWWNENHKIKYLLFQHRFSMGVLKLFQLSLGQKLTFKTSNLWEKKSLHCKSQGCWYIVKAWGKRSLLMVRIYQIQRMTTRPTL